MKMTVFCIIAQSRYQRIRRVYRLHRQDLKDRRSKNLLNVHKLPPDYTAQQPETAICILTAVRTLNVIYSMGFLLVNVS